MNQALAPASAGQQQRALWLSTFAFTVCFAVWMIFSIIGIQISQQLARCFDRRRFGRRVMPDGRNSLGRHCVAFQ